MSRGHIEQQLAGCPCLETDLAGKRTKKIKSIRSSAKMSPEVFPGFTIVKWCSEYSKRCSENSRNHLYFLEFFSCGSDFSVTDIHRHNYS